MTDHRPKMLVTYALPYANGSLHLGHMVGLIQADIWVRFQRMQGAECTYICGTDGHGTPIMIQADKLNIQPEVMIEEIRQEQYKDLTDFCVELDNYHTTHSKENQLLVEEIYQHHQSKGNISKHTIKQAFDPEKYMFLPDRYVKGICPRCNTQEQYGDSCESCGATYTPLELKNPYSTLSGATPIEKESEHYFFKLTEFEEFLKHWTRSGHLQDQVTHKLDEWFAQGLKEWDISRDQPYFGFTIPGTKDKYFYCWLDAPIGYMASFKNLCAKKNDLDFDEFWKQDSNYELYHFIGKDIVYFHALFWPALLKGAGFRTPTAIYTHGFLTVDGQKMSKSRGTFIKARTYLNFLKPEYLRYYLATKLSHRIEDLDIQFEDFVQRINADVVGKYINIASRSAKFIETYFAGKLSKNCIEPELHAFFASAGISIGEKFAAREYSQATRQIMALADRANQYIDEKKPWSAIKDTTRSAEVHDICTMSLNLFRILTIYLKPILPEIAKQAESLLNIPALKWEDKDQFLMDHSINPFKPLATRLDKNEVDAMKQAAQAEASINAPTATDTNLKPLFPAIKPPISIDDFAKIDLRVAKILKAEQVEGAEKLLRLELDLGVETRQIFAGIKAAFKPEQLIGKLTIMVANLEPRKMRFGVSEGMMLVASSEEHGLWLISPTEGALPGMPVK